MPKTIHVLTIQWRSWDRTVEVFWSHDDARRRVEDVARDNYPDDDGDTDAFADHGHSWYIDEATVPAL